MLTMTEAAAVEIKRVFAQQAKEAEDAGKEVGKQYLRIGVKGGGCSGFTYTMDVTDVKSENDESWESEGIEMICDPKSQLYLEGTSVDFKDGMMGRGFVFSNPNASGTCGCGSSFST